MGGGQLKLMWIMCLLVRLRDEGMREEEIGVVEGWVMDQSQLEAGGQKGTGGVKTQSRGAVSLSTQIFLW